MPLFSSFSSPSSGTSTSCAESQPPPIQLQYMYITWIVVVVLYLEVHPLCCYRCFTRKSSSALYKPFVVTGASLESPLSFLALHSKVLTLSSPRGTFVIVRERTYMYLRSASFGSTQPPTDCASAFTIRSVCGSF